MTRLSLPPGTAELDRQLAIERRVAVLRAERPGETNWIGYVTHEPGECIECDALRRLEAQDDWTYGDAIAAEGPDS